MTDENQQTPPDVVSDDVNAIKPPPEGATITDYDNPRQGEVKEYPKPPPDAPHPLAPLHERISAIADKIPEGDVHLRGIATVLRDLLGQVISGR